MLLFYTRNIKLKKSFIFACTPDLISMVIQFSLNKNILYVVFACVFGFCGNPANAQNLLWSRYGLMHSTEHTSDSLYYSGAYLYSSTIDHQGYLYIAGSYTSGNLFFGSTELTSIPYRQDNLYLTKYDAAGNLKWARQANPDGGIGSSTIKSVSADKNGNVIIAGEYVNSGIFAGDTAGGLTFGTAHYSCDSDLFITKLDSGGNVIWYRTYRNRVWNADPISYFTTTDKDNNIYFLGGFGVKQISFGGHTLTIDPTTVPDWEDTAYFGYADTAYHPDIFLVKYAPDGEVLWVKAVSGGCWEVANSINVDDSGNIIITGNFQSVNAHADGLMLRNILDSEASSPVCLNSEGIFVVKYSSSGEVLWAKNIGNNLESTIAGVATDSHDNIYLAGNFTSGLLIDSLWTCDSGSISAAFMIAYNSAGNINWKQELKNSGNTTVGGLQIGPISGNLYVTGSFQGAGLELGGTTIPEADTVAPSYTSTNFVAELSDSGAYLCSFGFSVYLFWNNILLDSSENIYLTGTNEGHDTTFFDDTDFVPCPDAATVFAAKFVPCRGPISDHGGNLTVARPSMKNISGIQIFPNPCSGTFTISYPGDPDPNSSLAIYNLEGILISDSALPSNDNTITVPGIPPGIYLAKVFCNGVQYVNKILVQ